MHDQSIPVPAPEATYPITEQNVVFLDQETHGIPSSLPYGYECIYLLESEGIFKIGRSETPRSRIRDLGLMNPRPLTLLHFVIVKKSIRAESSIHLQFREHRLHGEWFRLSPQEAIGVYQAMNEQVRRSAYAPSPRLPRPKQAKKRRGAR